MVKHYVRFGLHENIPQELVASIHRSNIHRWKNESDDKYMGCDLAAFIKKEIELVSRINRNPKIKKVNEVIFDLVDTFHKVLADVKGVKKSTKKTSENYCKGCR